MRGVQDGVRTYRCAGNAKSNSSTQQLRLASRVNLADIRKRDFRQRRHSLRIEDIAQSAVMVPVSLLNAIGTRKDLRRTLSVRQIIC
jgi:hypothetical protein